MVAFVISIILGIIGVIALGIGVASSRRIKSGDLSGYDEDGARVGRAIGTIGGVVALVAAGVLLFFGSILVTNGVGEAKVVVNPDGTIAFPIIEPGATTKAPWQDYADFDLFSQEVLYAGGDVAPSYSGGTVSGKEVTVSVGGSNGGSTQANLDISVTYSVDAAAVEDIYAQYKSQERFTKQVVEKTILSTIRAIPSKYTAVEFRGEFRQEAADRILSQLNERLNPLGVTVDFVNLQDIRYPESVENALRQVEEANQQALQQEANLRAAEVKAQQLVVEAQAQADANNILAQSLSPELLTQKYIDAISNGTTFVVPEGTTPFVTVR